MIKKRICWIDDMVDWSASAEYKLHSMIDSSKYELTIFHRKNGENIAQELMMYEFDAVLMDYHMEPFNGNKYIDDIRSELHLSYIPILFYSQDPTVDLNKLVVEKKDVIVCHRTALIDLVCKKLFP